MDMSSGVFPLDQQSVPKITHAESVKLKMQEDIMKELQELEDMLAKRMHAHELRKLQVDTHDTYQAEVCQPCMQDEKPAFCEKISTEHVPVLPPVVSQKPNVACMKE